MFKKPPPCSNRHASTATGPRPSIPRPAMAVREQGPSRPRVASPEQPSEPCRPQTRRLRSHLQGRDADMTSLSPISAIPSLFVGIDVASEKLDLARSDSTEVLTLGNDARAITR